MTQRRNEILCGRNLWASPACISHKVSIALKTCEKWGLAVSAFIFVFALSGRARISVEKNLGPATNVLFITVDTLRPDYLGCYGSRKVATPNIDSVAAEGTRFQKAISPVPLTLPSHCSIFTGMYPMATGVRDNLGYVLPRNQLTLAEILKQKGYRTGAFVGAYVLASKWGLDQGFDVYDDKFGPTRDPGTHWAVERKGESVARAALQWLERHAAAPFFCWIHLFDPHDPYDPPEPFSSRYREDPYAGEVAYTDHVIGQVLSALKRIGSYDNTLVIFLGDHAESLGEHREPTHGFFIYDSTVLVPLIIKLPRNHGSTTVGVIEEHVQLVDVAPTLLQALGIPRPPTFQGHGWFGAILGKEKTGSPAAAYCETYYPNEFGWSELRSWRTRDFKYILGPEPELYDLRIDSGEEKNLIAAKSAVAEQYKSALQAFEARFANQKATVEARTQLSAEDLERFRALGYIGGPTQGRRPEAPRRPDPKGKIDIYVLISKAMTEITQRQFQRALDTLRELLQSDSSIPTVHSLLGQCYLQLKKYKEAEQAFELVLKQEPDRLYPLFYLGLAHFQQHQYDKAAPLLEKAVLVDPKFFPAYNYLGLIYSDLGQTSRAIAVFSKAAAIQENFQTYQMLGFLYTKQKQLEKAVAAFQKAAALEPDNALAHFHLAGVYALQGRKELAQKEFQTAVRLDPRLREKVK